MSTTVMPKRPHPAGGLGIVQHLLEYTTWPLD